MGFLTKEQILGAQDLTHRDVEVPEWGGKVRVRTMTGEERDAYEIAVYGGEKTNTENLRARLLFLTLVDEQGNRLFADEADIVALGKKSIKAVQRVFKAVRDLNAMDVASMEDLAKNSGSAPGGASSSL